MGFLVFGLISWGAAMAVAHKLGHSRNRTGWLWGFWLGWLGVIILACMQNKATASLTATEQQVRELEAQVRLRELRSDLAQPDRVE
jgi:hypothetical protein